jgi:hypothetical protein
VSEAAACIVYAVGGAIGFGSLIWMMWTIRRNKWAPWDDDEA